VKTPFLPQEPFPGDCERLKRAQILRVNLAGESGAVAIYQGQLKILEKHPVRPLIDEMLEQEKEHEQAFTRWIQKEQSRPSVLMPLWIRAGFWVGKLSSQMGVNYAMTLTSAVEEVIEKHYASQLRALDRQTNPRLYSLLESCYEDEKNHKHVGRDHSAPPSGLLKLWELAISLGTKTAVFVAKRF
jgi:ubiquinone biosynthesis monooxygenase Coq7